MKKYDIDLRSEWRHLSSPELESILQAELGKESPDDDKVLTLLHILESREPDEPPVLSEREQSAFDNYKKRISSRQNNPVIFSRWLSVAASIVLVLGLLISVMPKQAEAETFWDMLQRMRSSVLEFFSGEGKKAQIEYLFETDNPGLQQVYDAAVEMGAEYPMVPMWLPEGSVLSDLEITETPLMKGLCATFSDDDIVYKMDIYTGEPFHQYYKDDSHYESYELGGVEYSIAKNNDRWIVIWTKKNIECSIFIDCQEDTLRRILKTIYIMEE